MITLTPEEAREYETGGLFSAVRAFRNRTNLGLVESKMAVEQWLRTGKQVAADGKSPTESLESVAVSKLSAALIRARTAEDALAQMKLKAAMIAGEVCGMAKDIPVEWQEPWARACGRMSEEFRKRL